MLKNKIILGCLGLLLVIGLVYAGTHSVIAVTVPDTGSDAKYTVTITSGGGDKTVIDATTPTVKKVVKKGDYTVLVTGNGSYYKSISTRAFLQTTDITTSLESEALRTFVGDNPGPCMYFFGNRLLSNQCSDTAYDIQEHVPATASLPTYIQRARSGDNVYGFTKGFATTKRGENILLLQDKEGVPGYYLQAVSDNMAGGPRNLVTVTNTDAEYTVKPYRDGVLVYDEGLTDLLYYPVLGGKPERISLKQPKNTELMPYHASVGSDSITVVYSSLDRDAESSENEADMPISKAGSEVLVYNSADDQVQYEFTETFFSARDCGTAKLCAISPAGLGVYDIADGSPAFVYGMHQITEMQQAGNSLLGIAADGIYRMNADDGTGYIDYSFGRYQQCGLQQAPRGYVLCVFDDNGNKSALYIDATQKDTDAIDKKLLTLRSGIGNAEASVYGRYVYISPAFGETIYDPARRIYVPDPAKARIANTAIEAAVLKSGIDRTAFTVINTGTQ